MEILTISEVAAMLKISKRAIYELRNPRMKNGDPRPHPLPSLKIGKSVRFLKSDVGAWIERLCRKEN